MKLVIILSLLIHTFTFINAESDNLALLKKLSNNNRQVVSFDASQFNQITSKPRPYGVLVAFTALSDQFKCQGCHELEKELPLVATALGKSKEQVYVATLDFSQSVQSIFGKYGIRQVPHLYYFGPTEGPKASGEDYESIDFSQSGLKAEVLAEIISNKAQIKIHISRPINYLLWGSVITSLIVGVSVLSFLATKLSFLFSSTKLWAYTTITFTAMMCAGYMWNTIRHPPFIGQGQNNQASLFAGGSQYQFGVETSIVAALYLLISIFFGLLITFVPTIGDPTVQRYSIYICTAGFLLTYSFFISVFKVKNGGYPYKLFF